MRPQEVQMREFEVSLDKSHICTDLKYQPCWPFRFQVLEKVKHENIVKLLAIEEEQEGRGKVKVLKKHNKKLER